MNKWVNFLFSHPISPVTVHWCTDLFRCTTVHIRSYNVKSHWKVQGLHMKKDWSHWVTPLNRVPHGMLILFLKWFILILVDNLFHDPWSLVAGESSILSLILVQKWNFIHLSRSKLNSILLSRKSITPSHQDGQNPSHLWFWWAVLMWTVRGK